MGKRFAESRDVSDVELLNAPFSQDIPSEVGIDIIVFDEQQFDYRRAQSRSLCTRTWRRVSLLRSRPLHRWLKYSQSLCLHKEMSEIVGSDETEYLGSGDCEEGP